ncbi:co-chaperone GroES [Myroides sp. LJL119]
MCKGVLYMISYYDFIVFTDVVFNDTIENDTIELQGGAKLFLDARFSEKRLAQREVIIRSVPLNYEGEDISSYQAIIDPTIYFRNMYHHGKGDNNEVPGMKGCFKVPASMIVAIRKDESEPWIGFVDNFIGEKVMDSNEEVKQGLIITEIAKPKELKVY